ncbi:MAG TPA: hypothetical protein VKZ93_00645 [Arenibacter sp.]|nr:hypothetical protein [Arenibacter sp.]
MKQLVFLLMSLFLLMGCTDRDDDLDGVYIRIKNESNITYDLVRVGEADKLHENIAPGAFSGYLEYRTAYSYAYISIDSGDENYLFQITDFVGETPLEHGFYTYALNISEEGLVQLDFRVDL